MFRATENEIQKDIEEMSDEINRESEEVLKLMTDDSDKEKFVGFIGRFKSHMIEAGKAGIEIAQLMKKYQK